MTDRPTDPTRIIVQNLSFSTTESELADRFSGLGEIVECVLATDANGKSRGFGFITFSDRESVQKATAEGAEFELGGRTLRVQVANQKREPSKGKAPREVKAFGPKLYCGDLPWELSAEELSAHFEKFGKVENAYLAEVQYAAPVNGYKPHRGFGFVEFSTEEEATKALKESHVIKDVAIRVTSAKGEAKGGDRKRREKNDNDNNAARNKKDNSGKEKEKKKDERERKPKKDAAPKEKDNSKAAEPKAVEPKAEPVKKKKEVVLAAAPAKNPWGAKKDAGASPAVSTPDYPSLADVASGKVKPHIKTEDEIAAEIAAERAKEGKGKGRDKGKEEATDY